MRIAESERSIMTILWEKGPTTAKEIAHALQSSIGWSKTTTYTVLKRCIDKGYILREDPHFVCTALLTKAQVTEMETEALLKNGYDGSADLLVAALVSKKKLKAADIKKLYDILAEAEN